MLDEILGTCEPFPPHLHRHLLQLYLIRHRRPPATETERRRAVFEYLTRPRSEKTREGRVHVHAELAAWLNEEDDHVRGWGPVARLAGIVHQFSGDLRKRYDLGVERDYKEFACYVALTVQGVLQWPEEVVGESLRRLLWEPAPGVPATSRVGMTRALLFVRRNSARARDAQGSGVQAFSRLLLAVLSDVATGRLPGYVLSPAQVDYLARPVALPGSRIRMTGLVHHLVVERGLVPERDLARADVATTVGREAADVLSRLRLPAAVAAAHGVEPAAVVPIAPAPADEPAAVVTVVGPVGHGSGLGAAARATLGALQAAGVPVEVLNLKAAWGRNDEHGGSGHVPRVRGDVNILHFNPDVIIENVSQFGPEQFEGRYNIGYFFWETSKACLAHRLGIPLVDEIWVSTEYCRELFQAATDKPVIVVGTPVPKIDDVAWATREYFGLPRDAFTFLYTFDGASRFTRKNPQGAIAAFQRAFPSDDGVRLVLKTQNTKWLTPADERIYAEVRRQARRDRRIVVIDEGFAANEVHGLISVCDCYVALQRSEGFGYGMAEAMKLGVPVIATAYSGNADFTTAETAWIVRHRLVPVSARDFVYDEEGQEWADPDLAHAAERMLEVRAGTGRAERVRRAREWVDTRYDSAAVGRACRERLEAIRAGRRPEALAAGGRGRRAC